jgi:hypothetical protein
MAKITHQVSFEVQLEFKKSNLKANHLDHSANLLFPA